MVLALSGPLVIGGAVIGALVLIAVMLRAEDSLEREEDEQRPSSDS